MGTPRAQFLADVLNFSRAIPLGKLIYFRERFRSALYQMVLQEFLAQQRARGLTKADLARRIGRKPEQISRWLGAPGNWTLDTASDLMLAMGQEPRCTKADLSRLATRNFDRPDWIARSDSDPVRTPMQQGSGSLPTAELKEWNYEEHRPS
jgi:hypothetical protein